jgi:hypothetical protein
VSTATTNRPRFTLSPSARKAVLTTHIIVSVGLLGDSAGYLAVAIRAAATSEATVADAAYRMLDMFSVVFGIPLSFAALLTGITLGVGSKWGVFRYPWVMAKLLLIVSIIAVGAFVLRGGMDAMLTGGGGGEVRLVAGAAYDVLALAVATGLAVYKPGRPHSRKAAADRQALLPRP